MFFTPEKPEPEDKKPKSIWDMLAGAEPEGQEQTLFSPPQQQTAEYQIMLETLLSGETQLEDHARWLDITEQLEISAYVQNCLTAGQYESVHALLTHLICENTVWRRMLDYGLDSGNLYYGNDISFIEDEELGGKT